MTAGHDPDADALRQAQASSAEMYLRLLVEAELRRAVEYPRHLAGRATGGPQADPVTLTGAVEATSGIGASPRSVPVHRVSGCSIPSRRTCSGPVQSG